MNCHISSEKLNNPQLKEILFRLTGYFQSIDTDFYVIGATARDIILTAIHEQNIGRATKDLDIIIAVSDWSRFEKISEEICSFLDFEKDTHQKQRFIYKKGYIVDIVPFGEIAKNGKIYWQPDENVAMSILGFVESAKNVLEINIDNEFIVKVIQLPGIFILKLNAFNDRCLTNNKDADDMALILENYLDINQDRAIDNYDEIYDIEPFDTFIAGASLMGKDIKQLFEDNQTLNTFAEMLQKELTKQEESLLINQMLETHRSLKYEQVFDAVCSLYNQLAN